MCMSMKISESELLFSTQHKKWNPVTRQDGLLPMRVTTSYPAKFDPSNTIEMKQNDAYTLEEPVTTATNESYNYPAKFDPSNTVEMIQNDAYTLEEPVATANVLQPAVELSA